VQYSVSGSASPGKDYAALPGSASLGENDSQTSIDVNVPGDDGVFEGNETVVVRLLGVQGEISVTGDSATVGGSEGCPAPGDDGYQPGLAAGHFCVQLTIERRTELCGHGTGTKRCH
jgi:hypothetical protein